MTLEWCICYGRRGVEDALEVPVVERPPSARMCGDEGPHHHLCHRPDGHTGRHADHLDAGLGLVSAVWR